MRDSYGPTPELPFEFNHAIDCLTGYRTVSVLAFLNYRGVFMTLTVNFVLQ